MRHHSLTITLATCFCFVTLLSPGLFRPVNAQDAKPAEAKTKTITIPGTVKYLDPAEFVPPDFLKVVDIEENVALKDLQRVIQEHGVSCVVLLQDFADAGFDLNRAAKLPALPLHLALYHYFENIRPTKPLMRNCWSEFEGVTVITPFGLQQTKVYDTTAFSDLGIESDRLIQLILTASSGPWMVIDGQGGSVNHAGHTLKVENCAVYNLTEIDRLLKAVQCLEEIIYVNDPPEHADLREALNHPLTVEFKNVDLKTVAAELKMILGVPVEVDWRDLQNNGVSEEAKLSFALTDQSLSSAASVVSDTLDFPIRLTPLNGKLSLSTHKEVEIRLISVVCNVGHLLTQETPDIESFIKKISNTKSGLWSQTDGIGGHIIVTSPIQFVIQQSETTMNEVVAMINALRKPVN